MFHRAAAVLLLWVCVRPPAAAQESVLRQAARLDAEQKCGEAERLYQQALAQGSPSPALLNNLGNHYLVCGDPDKARTYFERLVKLNPQHANANLQLARIAAERHEGARALEYLSRVNDTQPATRLLRAEALHWAGRRAEASALLDGVGKEAGGEAQLLFLYGLTCARIGAYERAEAAFAALLAAHPDDFDLLLNLGRAAARAGHYDRAGRTLEAALRVRPDNVDALAELGQASAAVHDYARAVFLLARARQQAPQRAEIALALARAAHAGEYYGDAAIAYDEYLRLRPGDEAARRDRALVCGLTDARQAEGLRDLEAYVRKHPTDPLGHWGLARLTWRDHPQEALEHLNAAVRLDARLAAAYLDRGWLLNRLGRTADALPDFEKAAALDPKDFRALDQLGLTYSSLDRPADAEKVLRRALAMAPDNPDVLMHLGRALMELGREEEGQQYLAKFQALRPKKVRGPWKQAGMIEAATVSDAERTRMQIERLRRDARAHPEDAELQFRLAALLLTDGRTDEATREFRELLGRNAENRTWEEAGRFLLGFEQYPLAREFLERAAAGNPAANLDLATALFFTDGPDKALHALEQVPDREHCGDCLLLHARILDASGKADEAEKVLEQGLRLSVSRPQIAQQAALLLVRHDRKDLALELLGRTSAGSPDLLLTSAIVLALENRDSAAEKTLREVEAQWPEWDRPYVAHGLLLERRGKPAEAAQRFRTAVALGSPEPAARCALARLSLTRSSDPQCACAAGLYELLLGGCAQPR